MDTDSILLLNGEEILDLSSGSEIEIIEIIKNAYKTHSLGYSSLPHSSFLRFPMNEQDRIIALPAYLGGDFSIAGLKWIASFPNNISSDLERASAILILNSTLTGRPKAVMESSIISSKRTAASAAIAADLLLKNRELKKIGIIGCGLINFETIRFILAVRPKIETLYLYDLDVNRSEIFRNMCCKLSNNFEITIDNIESVTKNSDVICFATTASKPYLFDIEMFSNDSIIIHTSLRDLSKEIILASDNIVDDIDHCCRANTSVHLAEQYLSKRDFIRCTIGDILNGKSEPRQSEKITVYSPFGLGILDIALGNFLYSLAVDKKRGYIINDFFPPNWMKR